MRIRSQRECEDNQTADFVTRTAKCSKDICATARLLSNKDMHFHLEQGYLEPEVLRSIGTKRLRELVIDFVGRKEESLWSMEKINIPA